MSAATPQQGWAFFKVGLLVTGVGEREFLPALFRPLSATGHCHFEVIGRIGQRSPITGEKKLLKMVGSGKTIPDKDATTIGFAARRWLDGGKDRLVVLVDDLEHERRDRAREVFHRYRQALDVILGKQSPRASVHFLVNMVEAYYFADTSAINAVLGTSLSDYEGDVEEIRHPKRDLKKLVAFDEKRDGARIVALLDLAHVLGRPDTCASLRVLFAWLSVRMGLLWEDAFCLGSGIHDIVTGPQLAAQSAA